MAGVQAQVSDARAKELRQRFEEGCKLVEQNRLESALEVFAEILREDGKARGSLLMSGLVENQRFRFVEAAGFFERFLQLEPNHEQGLIGAVKAFQGAGRESEGEAYRLRLWRLRQTAKSEKLKVMASYERERIALDGGGWISVQEYFEEGDLKPRWAWLKMRDEKVIARRLQLNRLPEAEAKGLREVNAALAPGPVFVLSEAVYEGGEFQRTQIHRIISGAAPYAEVRAAALAIVGR
jgi:tetratricopeptide (TPR) repeat protein